MDLPPAPTLPDLVLVEGDEEVQYLYIELPNNVPERMIVPGASISFKGLESDCPSLQLEDGTMLTGEYEEPLGSIMFFQRSMQNVGQPYTVKYRGHCESKLVFQSLKEEAKQKPGKQDKQQQQEKQQHPSQVQVVQPAGAQQEQEQQQEQELRQQEQEQQAVAMQG